MVFRYPGFKKEGGRVKKRKVIHFGDFNISACGVRLSSPERITIVWTKVTCKNCLKQMSHYEPVKSEKDEPEKTTEKNIGSVPVDEAVSVKTVETIPGRGSTSTGTI